MTIETKFNVNESVYVLIGRAFYCRKIKQIEAHVSFIEERWRDETGKDVSVTIQYRIENDDFDGTTIYSESQVFKSLEDAIYDMKKRSEKEEMPKEKPPF